MRRSCFYMNQRFTQRHLNAISSPLLTGYVNTSRLSVAGLQAIVTQMAASSSGDRFTESAVTMSADEHLGRLQYLASMGGPLACPVPMGPMLGVDLPTGVMRQGMPHYTGRMTHHLQSA